MFEYKCAKSYQWKFQELINLGKIEVGRWSILWWFFTLDKADEVTS